MPNKDLKPHPTKRIVKSFAEEVITPEQAALYLEASHPQERRLRPSRVAQLENAIKRGEWLLSTDAIAFDWDGFRINGQHRLTAIVNTGVACPALIARGLDPRTREVIDQGLKRTTEDVLALGTQETVTIKWIMRLLEGTYGASPAQVRQVWAVLKPEIVQLLTATRSRRDKLASSQPVRAAAVFSLLQFPGEAEHVLAVYKNLVLANVAELPPVALEFHRQIAGGRADRRADLDLFARAMTVFNPHRANLKKVSAKGADRVAAGARHLYAVTAKRRQAQARPMQASA